MLLNHVVDVKKNKFKISFLDPQLKNINKELNNFRNEFFESLFDYQESFPYVKKILADKKDTEGFLEFLREKTIIIKIPKNSECKSLKILSEELVLSVMLQKPFDIKANIHDQKILQKLNKFIRENVIDFGSKKLKETFLSDNSKSNEEVHNFRQYFFEDLKVFCNAFKDKNIKEIEELVKLILEEGENEKAVVDVFPSGEVDTTEIDKNILEFLNLITFAVNQNNFDNLISNEMNKLITKSEDQILLYRWREEVKLSDICSGCEIMKIITPELCMYNFSTSAIMNLGKGIDKNFNSIYIDRTLVQSERVNINSLLEQSQDIVVITLHDGI
ncbi:Phospholipid phosphatase 4 [Armadillidium nasatum]|uniref:Phospholipid phosphatase 4 n=1 Tax=Armadillidium nasatum TaxID=96803 RepID=A0A5N5T491_9CRUS|nr:Phospholipid phosphatase 4 [Armadillidium nasatum]